MQITSMQLRLLRDESKPKPKAKQPAASSQQPAAAAAAAAAACAGMSCYRIQLLPGLIVGISVSQYQLAYFALSRST